MLCDPSRCVDGLEPVQLLKALDKLVPVWHLEELKENLLLRCKAYMTALADLDGEETVSRMHLAEALSYRGAALDRQAA